MQMVQSYAAEPRNRLDHCHAKQSEQKSGQEDFLQSQVQVRTDRKLTEDKCHSSRGASP